MVAYNDRSTTILDPTRVSGNADWIIDEIRSRVQPGGSTNAEAGWCGASTWPCARPTKAEPCW